MAVVIATGVYGRCPRVGARRGSRHGHADHPEKPAHLAVYQHRVRGATEHLHVAHERQRGEDTDAEEDAEEEEPPGEPPEEPRTPTRPPILASEALRKEVAPAEPRRVAIRGWSVLFGLTGVRVFSHLVADYLRPE